jgi:hypothetical protein
MSAELVNPVPVRIVDRLPFLAISCFLIFSCSAALTAGSSYFGTSATGGGVITGGAGGLALKIP